MNRLLSVPSHRGDQTSPATEPDGVLAAQVLPAVWNKQGEVGRGHRIPVQLSRPVVLPRLLREGDFRAHLSGNGHRGSAGDHGGMASEGNHGHSEGEGGQFELADGWTETVLKSVNWQ